MAAAATWRASDSGVSETWPHKITRLGSCHGDTAASEIPPLRQLWIVGRVCQSGLPNEPAPDSCGFRHPRPRHDVLPVWLPSAIRSRSHAPRPGATYHLSCKNAKKPQPGHARSTCTARKRSAQAADQRI